MKNKQTKNKFYLIFLCMMAMVLLANPEPRREIKYFNNGKQISESEFIWNGKNGIQTIYQNGIKKTEIEFKSGKKSGLSMTFYPDGKKQTQTGYLKGIKNGQYLEWHQNGQKGREGKYENGKKQGRWLKWDERANLLFEEFWKNGKITLLKNLILKTERSFIYFKNGQLRYEREYRRNLKHGKWLRWDENGNRIYEREYLDGMKHGKWTEWNDRGNIISEEQWEMGKKPQKIN